MLLRSSIQGQGVNNCNHIEHRAGKNRRRENETLTKRVQI